jgi:acyl-CoA thioester hydrolase
MAAVEQHVTYDRELHAGDLVTIHSSVLEVKEKSIRFTHEMRNDSAAEMAARTTLKAVHLDTVARKACVFPPAVMDRARAMIRAEGAQNSCPDSVTSNDSSRSGP